ncbi:hypothetical protein S7711_11423 [Stachybotrys chartarum IBT 7711]|uniref:Uncharacterized protein n=1 Tax=Stachybotrys chartarum (strain CBS 109288 / IBT 7711) TaxID=1280523 RepID=A0A084B810_STACB|nr:hypothetical protein S7711_11423 [Stachybotrys chartarum IBT 7711]
MASSVALAEAVFEAHQVSPSVSADDSPTFVKEHGIFYQENDAIGSLVDQVKPGVDSLERFKPTLHADARAIRILEPFLVNPPEKYFALGSDPGHFFVSTTAENQDDRLLVYMWPAGTRLEFFDKSHKEAKGVRAANGLFEAPYPFLKRRYGPEIEINMERGG